MANDPAAPRATPEPPGAETSPFTPVKPTAPAIRTVQRAGAARPPIDRIGLDKHPLRDVYHFLLRANWPALFGLLAGLYLVANLVFATLYHSVPGAIENSDGSFREAFFFSVQTMSTIGYGKLIPSGLYANLLVTIEALTGLLGVAVATGLIFAKFSRPTARVLFSRVAVVAPRDGVQSLVFRLANERENQIVEATLHVTFARNETTLEGESVRRFHDLKLVRSQNAIFSLSWTVIHPIGPDSPLHGMSPAELRERGCEIVISLLGLDETFAQQVYARHSYSADDLVYGHRFVDILTREGGRLAVDYRRFHDVGPI